jgi:hypothetical protein
VLARVQCWNQDRIYYAHSRGNQVRIPVGFTDLAPVDPFVAVSNGRSLFRADDLLQLARLVKELRDERRKRV